MERFVRTALLGVAVAALGAGAFALGAQTSSSTAIRACINKRTGALRLRGGHACRKRKERVLSWNRRGPVGPAGTAGAAGATGPAGVAGPKGDTGPAGPVFTAVKMGDVSDPPATPDEAIETARGYNNAFTFTAPTAGRYYVQFFTPGFGRDCTFAAPRAGLYVDGAPVPGTLKIVGPASAPNPGEWVALVNLTAAPHEVSLQADGVGGTVTGAGTSTIPAWTVMLTG